MEPDQPRWRFEDLRPVAPQLGYAYRGLVPHHGKSSRHSPGWFSCWRVDEGWAEVRFDDGRQARAEVGEWLLCPPFLPRYQIFPTGAAILSLAFHLALPTELDPHERLPRALPARGPDPMLEAAVAVVAAIGGGTDDRGIRYQRQGLALDEWLRLQHQLTAFVAEWYQRVFARAAAAVPALDARVHACLRLLAQRPRMGPVPYEALALHTGLGRVQLDRLFKRELGRSPKQELDRLCLERVLRRLDDHDRPIKAIATELGFTDSSHLCRWFARHLGQSPQRYRRTGAV